MGLKENYLKFTLMKFGSEMRLQFLTQDMKRTIQIVGAEALVTAIQAQDPMSVSSLQGLAQLSSRQNRVLAEPARLSRANRS